MSEFLKGNFDVKRPVEEKKKAEDESEAEKLKRALKEKALATLGGSMVYMEREQMTWDGEDSDK